MTAPVSGDRLLRLIRAVPVPVMLAPRVIGIDDWAWRKGKRYGTIVVDLERNRPIDLLPDRQADTVAAWLKAHPGVEIVGRDRAGAYADGIRQGAPGAIQVADRWHLLRNLGDALGEVLTVHHRDLQAAARPPGGPALRPRPPGGTSLQSKRHCRLRMPARRPAGTSGVPRPTPPAKPATRRSPRWTPVAGRRRASPRRSGWTAERCGSGCAPGSRRPGNARPRGSLLDPFTEHLRRRWDEGCHNATRLWREIRALGFPGQSGLVREWARPLRQVAAGAASAEPAAWRTPSRRRTAWLVVAGDDTIETTERAFITALIARSPKLARTIELARALRVMVRGQRADELDGWLAAAADTALAGFADGLKRDLAAVRAALSLPWSTGPVEGQISTLKTTKRTMNGRGGFDLLRYRVFEAA